MITVPLTVQDLDEELQVDIIGVTEVNVYDSWDGGTMSPWTEEEEES